MTVNNFCVLIGYPYVLFMEVPPHFFFLIVGDVKGFVSLENLLFSPTNHLHSFCTPFDALYIDKTLKPFCCWHDMFFLIPVKSSSIYLHISFKVFTSPSLLKIGTIILVPNFILTIKRTIKWYFPLFSLIFILTPWFTKLFIV